MKRRTFIRRSGEAIVGLTAGLPIVKQGNTAWAQAMQPRTEILYNGIVLPSSFPPQYLDITELPETDQIPEYLTTPPSPIFIDIGRQLFVDDFLIESLTNLNRVYHQAEYHPANPLIVPTDEERYSFTDREGFEVVTHLACPYSDGVWWDAYQKKFRAWFVGGNNTLKHAESTDGVNWTRTILADGSDVLMPIPGRRDSGMVWIDYAEEDPAHRYKMSLYSFEDLNNWVFTSPDGYTWPQFDQPIVRTAPYASDLTKPFGDRTTFFYNPFRRKWIWSLRDLLDLRSVGGWEFERTRRYLEGDCLLEMSQNTQANTLWLRADQQARDIGGQLYNLDGIAYESIMIFMMSIRDKSAKTDRATGESRPKLNQVHAGYSRDGFSVFFPGGPERKPLLPLGNTGDWNEGNIQSAGGGITIVGPETNEELYFFCSGRHNQVLSDGTLLRHGHLGLATLRRDGFASLDAPSGSEGTLTTRLIQFNHSRGYLFVNVNAPSGSLTAEVIDDAGQVVAGLSRAECIAITDNSTKKRIEWSSGKTLTELSGRPFKLRLFLTNGQLYSFWVSPSSTGSSEGFVGAGGPGYEMYQDLSPVDTTSTESNTPQPNTFELHHNAPNPFTHQTNIHYTLNQAERITLKVFDLQGREIQTLVDGFQKAGAHQTTFNAGHLAAGIYICRLASTEQEQTLRMILAR